MCRMDKPVASRQADWLLFVCLFVVHYGTYRSGKENNIITIIIVPFPVLVSAIDLPVLGLVTRVTSLH